jgi:2'-5' RNA ligase
MRLFLALEPDASAREALAKLSSAARRAAGDLAPAARWVAPDNLHATVHFLGEIDVETRARVTSALGVSLPVRPIDAGLDQIGTFPPAGPPRVVWVSLTAADALRRVHAALGERLAGAGLPVETRPFSPHVTLARVPDQDRRRARDLLRRLAVVAVPAVCWRIDRVTLFESDLSGAVPRYAAVQRVTLGAS